MGVALPGRFDEAIRVAIVRRYPGCPVCVRGLCFSLLTLGLIDTVALSPLATAAAAFPGNSPAVRAGFAVVGLGGLGAAAVVLGLPRLCARTRLASFRLFSWVAPRATPWRDAARASAPRPRFVAHPSRGDLPAPQHLRDRALLPARDHVHLRRGGLGRHPDRPRRSGDPGHRRSDAPRRLWRQHPDAVGFALAAQLLLILAGASIFLAAVAWRTGIHAWSFRPGRAARLARI